MKSTNFRVVMLVVSLFLAPALWAQTPAAANQSAASPAPSAAAAEVPRLIKFSGTLLDALDQPLAGPVGVTFALHTQQTGGAALWMETQNVTPDVRGLYTVFLGANSAHGVPAELFASGEARWLEVQVERQAEQPRVLLVSVPYALKAADADTLGGKPLSAFVTTEVAASGSNSASGKRSTSAGVALPAVSGTGSTNVVAKWLDNIGTLGNSTITDDGTNVNMTGNAGALAYKFTGNATPPTDPTATILNAANIGPVFSGLSFKVRTGLTAPADALSIDFNRNVSMTGNASALTYKFTGNAALPTDATATILNAANIGPVFSGFSFRVRTGSPPADALSVDPSQNVILSGNLNLSGAGKAIIFPNGTVMSSAATGVGGGTITGVTAGTGLSGGGAAGGVTLGIANGGVTNALLGANSVTNANIADASLSPAKITGTAATLGANSFTGNQLINGNVGIGTTTPLGKLEIQGGADSSGVNDPQAVALAYRLGGFRHWIRTRHSAALGSGNAIDFFVNNSGSAGGSTGPGIGSIQVMTLDSGNVGIGTTAPSDPLDVFGPPTDFNGPAIFSQGGFSTAAGGAAADGIDPFGGNASGPGGFGGFGVFAVAGNATAATSGTGGDGGDFFGGSSSGTSGVGGVGVFGQGGGGGPGGPGGIGIDARGGGATGVGGVAGDGGDFIAGAGINGAANGLAGFFSGDISVTGAITAGTKDFKIDHPLDPANKYLVHASVESSEMKNIYDGMATLDASGSASVSLPGWFEVLNKDFRYQLTAIGAPGPNLYIAQEIQGGHFVIAGGQPGMKVSWQVTGVRQDAFAKAHPLVVEEEKLPVERGHYIHPALYGAPEERGIEWARHPQLMKKMKEGRAKQAQVEPVRLAPAH